MKRARFRWDKQYLYWGVTIFAVVVAGVIVYSIFARWDDLRDTLRFIGRALSPVLWGLVIAYILTPLARLFERMFSRLFRSTLTKRPQRGARLTRVLSIILAILCALAVLALLLVNLLPQVYVSVEALVLNLPDYLDEAVVFIQRTLDNIPALEITAVSLLTEAENLFLNWINESVLPNLDLVIVTVSMGLFEVLRGVFNLVVGLVLSVYVMYNREQFAAQVKKILHAVLPGNYVPTTLRGLRYVDRAFGRFFFGRVLDSLFVGTVTFLFLTIMGMPHVALITLIIAITNTVPFFGPFIGGIPSALLLMAESPLSGLIFIIFIIVLQQISGNIVGPKLMAHATGLKGFWVLFALLVGFGLFGFVGMLLGVPVFSLIYDGIRFLTNRRLKRRALSTDTLSYAGKLPPGLAAPPPKETEEDSDGKD
ncbi:MAG: AI-2E family transporter [Oscillospiraceae bacterium]|nr:AI-2E family transporter [Oscillospiraceae bacterium]